MKDESPYQSGRKWEAVPLFARAKERKIFIEIYCKSLAVGSIWLFLRCENDFGTVSSGRFSTGLEHAERSILLCSNLSSGFEFLWEWFLKIWLWTADFIDWVIFIRSFERRSGLADGRPIDNTLVPLISTIQATLQQSFHYFSNWNKVRTWKINDQLDFFFKSRVMSGLSSRLIWFVLELILKKKCRRERRGKRSRGYLAVEWRFVEKRAENSRYGDHCRRWRPFLSAASALSLSLQSSTVCGSSKNGMARSTVVQLCLVVLVAYVAVDYVTAQGKCRIWSMFWLFHQDS